MLKDITIGQYYYTDSVLHKLDPRVKLMGTLVFLISLFITDNIIGYGIATIALFSVIASSKVPLKFIVRGLKAIVILLLISVSFNLFMTPGTVVLHIYKLKITKEGILMAAMLGTRLIYLIIGSSMMTLTTTPNNLTDGLEKGLRFLKVLRIPVHEIAMMMSIALRFIPILMEETDKIMKAQIARGADFESGGVFKRAKGMVPLLIPLFVSAFRRANDLAIAMDARCYRGGEGRTKMKPLHYEKRDYITYIIFAIYLAIMVGANYLFDYLYYVL